MIFIKMAAIIIKILKIMIIGLLKRKKIPQIDFSLLFAINNINN
jgi:hypothetical protein